MGTHRVTSTTNILFAPLFAVLLTTLPAGATRAEAAVTATVTANQLVINGDGADNRITLRVQAGALTEVQVLDGTTVVGSFERSSFASIVIDAAGGNDTISFSRTFGIITQPARIDGGLGDDRISGGSGDDILIGGAGNDMLFWNAGDGSDVIGADAGFDTCNTTQPTSPSESLSYLMAGAPFPFSRAISSEARPPSTV